MFKTYAETVFGGDFETEAEYREADVQELITEKGGWMVWPLIEYSYRTVNLNLTRPAPSPPTWENWLGTDDQARDVLARLIYGFRISVIFGLVLTLFSSIVGVAAGAVQGYFGGWTDLLFQRFIEIWSGLPILFLLIILASIVTPNFWWLLGIMLLFRLDVAGRRGARGVPARAQFRLCPRRARARGGRTSRSCAGTCCPTPWSPR